MTDAPHNAAISDWTVQSMFTGTLTNRQNLTAVIRLDALMRPTNIEADQTPADSAASKATLGLFRITARDDGQPDPVHVGQLLFAMLDRHLGASSIIAYWGNRSIGIITRPRNPADLVATTYILPPATVRLTKQAIREACDAGSL